MGRWVRTVVVGAGLAGTAGVGAGPLQAQDVWGAVGDASHWCMFNTPCNWTSHFTIGYATTHALHRVGVPRPVASGASALMWVAKEIRDDRKWGNVLGTPDSNGDIISGVLGALLAYHVLAPDDDLVFVQPSAQSAGAVDVGITLH